jgi:iron complex transport system ATP-binding protein
MIEIRNISYQIKNRRILGDISCVIEEGKLTAIIGPNGSGKSTLLKCIMRFIDYSGEILIDGKTCSAGFDLAKQISYFDQTQRITFPHTVFDTILMGRRPHAPYRYTQTDYTLTTQTIKELDLIALKNRPINRLSGGELQKAFLARSLVQDTKYMLLDEPFNNLDPFYQITIIKKLIELKNRKSIVLVLHDISMFRFFDTIIMIKNGEIIDTITKDNCTRERLKQLYDTDFDTFYNGKEKIYAPI